MDLMSRIILTEFLVGGFLFLLGFIWQCIFYKNFENIYLRILDAFIAILWLIGIFILGMAVVSMFGAALYNIWS